ncbi:MAG: hypothetical protein Roseis2KO_37770 [Roseivirga sp.]
MRTSLNEIQQIERHLLGQTSNEESLLMEAKMSLNPDLAEKVIIQQESYALIREYGRKKLRAEIGQVERKLFESPGFKSFRQRIFDLFL